MRGDRMTQQHDPKPDARLRQSLAELSPSTDTSPAHDDAVLASARAVADEIAAGDARRPQARRSLEWARPLGLAAAVAIAIVGLSWILPGVDRSGNDQLRGVEASGVVPQPGAVIDTAPTELRWSAQPGAHQYRVTLRDASAAVVWQSAETTEPHVRMDSANLQAGSTYFWTVSVAGAAAPSELGPFMFQIVDR
jgi:hypothetical protein